MLFVFIVMQDENLGKIQGIGAEKSQEEARAELRRYSKKLSRFSEHLAIAKKVLATAHTMWIAGGQNPCFLAAA